MIKLKREEIVELIRNNPGISMWDVWKSFKEDIHITYQAVIIAINKLEKEGFIKSELLLSKENRRFKKRLFVGQTKL